MVGGFYPSFHRGTEQIRRRDGRDPKRRDREIPIYEGRPESGRWHWKRPSLESRRMMASIEALRWKKW
jgi:hypothetical protein